MQLSWKEVLGVVGGQTRFLIAAAAHQEIVSEGMARDRETFKMEWKADAHREIEKVENELQLEPERDKNARRMTAPEHKVRFSKRLRVPDGKDALFFALCKGVRWGGGV
jgi:hypothetical protein